MEQAGNRGAIEWRGIGERIDSVTSEASGIRGVVEWKLLAADGSVVEAGETHNLITEQGDKYYGERAAGISSPPAQVTGMKLGTGTTTPSKTGAGAALVTYLTNSHQALDAGYPASSKPSSARRITWVATFAAGKATTSGSNIAEVVLVTDTLANATSTAGNTIARALVSPTLAKAADQILVVTWQHDLLGA